MTMGEWDDTAVDTLDEISHDTVMDVRETTHTDWPPAPPPPSSDELLVAQWPAATNDELCIATLERRTTDRQTVALERRTTDRQTVWPAATDDELSAASTDDLDEPPIRRAAFYAVVRRPTTAGES